MTVPQLLKVTGSLYYFESRKVTVFAVCGLYMIVLDKVALIEVGTSKYAPYLLQASECLGNDLERVNTLIPTHVHLDHADDAGWLVEKLPHLKVCVHHRGLKHLTDACRLIENARVLYATMEKITLLHGEILPIPMDNLVGIEDSFIPLSGGHDLQSLDTPGHGPPSPDHLRPGLQKPFLRESLWVLPAGIPKALSGLGPTRLRL
jgi:glyoxylase-like metal-dependent hydrolase (beta-lactamase superfamily II)